MFVLVRDFIATKIAAVQSSTTQNTKILDDLTFSNKHFVETCRLVTDSVAISYPASRVASIFPRRRLCSQSTISGSLNQLATESITIGWMRNWKITERLPSLQFSKFHRWTTITDERKVGNQVWNWSKVIQNFPARGDDLDLKFVFAFACQVIRNFTETYDWMPILASNPLLMSILINSTSLEFYETDFYGEIIWKILQSCLFDHAW